MSRVLSGLALFAFTVALSPAARAADEACAGFVTSGAAVEEIRALEEAGSASNVKGQTLADGERMFAPEYVSVGQNGAITTREAILKTYVDGKFAPWAARFDIKQLDIKVYCDTAIAIGLAEAAAKAAPEKSAQFRWLNVWGKSDAGWRLVASQFTRF